MKYLFPILLLVLLPLSLSAQDEPEGITFKPTSEMTTPERLVQEQLVAYNERNIDAFLAPFSDSVRIYNFPATLSAKGRENMRFGYSRFFESNPKLHCTILNRIVEGNTVIDHEYVTGLANGLVLRAIAIYKIRDEKIAEVYFITER